MRLPDGGEVGMRMWMRGEREREIFQALSPAIDALTRTPMPYDVKNTPTQTFIARQYGEAWTRPFAALYEPVDTAGSAIREVHWSDGGEPGTVGVCVVKYDGRQDRILSSDEIREMNAEGIRCRAILAVVSDDQYFLARGTELMAGGVRISADRPATVALVRRNGAWYYTADAPCRIRIEGRNYRLPASAMTPVR